MENARRYLVLLGAIVPILLISYAIYIEKQFYLEPCPLCVLQRIIYLLVSLFFVFRCFWGKTRIVGMAAKLGCVFFAFLGMGIAARHTWIQHYPPPDLPSCLPGLDYLLEAFPFVDALKKALMGSVECTEVQWTFIGLSIPELSLMAFIGLLFISLVTIKE